MRYLAVIVALCLTFLTACGTTIVAQDYDDAVQKIRAEKKLDVNRHSVERAAIVMRQLAEATAKEFPHTATWNWEIHVANYKNATAWAFDGGKVLIVQGLFNDYKVTDAELAMVIAHEIAHAVLDHPKQVQDLNNDTMTTFGRTVRQRIELEADRVGQRIASRAGYSPQAMVSLLHKMRSKSGDNQPMHYPSWAARIEQAMAAR